jgi:magnesium-transporting ATPase (P-type)
MLTGESTPIIKAHLPLLETRFDYENDSKHMLYSGTKIVQKRPENKKPLLCICYSTGFNTVRGNLIRSVLYPKEGDIWEVSEKRAEFLQSKGVVEILKEEKKVEEEVEKIIDKAYKKDVEEILEVGKKKTTKKNKKK